MSVRTFTVIKLDGTPEPFSSDKLRNSMLRSGAAREDVDRIITDIEPTLRDGITTSEIYKRAFALLKRRERPVAARYSMKRAIRELGPSGFPFEDFVAELFRAQGYRTTTGAMAHGRCALHELDLRAEKSGDVIGAELKFHNNLGIKSDLKIALYVRARFEDLKAAYEENHITEGWLITNTGFTENAMDYAKCVGLTMVSWNYPEGGTLQDLIERSGVQPVTALTSLSLREKRLLLERRVVLCKMLPDNAHVMESIGMPTRRIDEVLRESRAVCSL